MSLLFGAFFLQQSAAANRPHQFGFNTARTSANDTLFEIWNGATNSARAAAVDLNGKYYSSAWTVGDLPYVVAGGVSGLKRMDTLAIGSANTFLTSSGTAPQWSTTLTSATFASPTFTGTVTLTGSTVAGTPTWSSNQAITLSTAAQPNVTSLGTLAANLLFTDATYDIGQSGATRPRNLYLSGTATIGGAITASGSINIPSGTGYQFGSTQVVGAQVTGWASPLNGAHPSPTNMDGNNPPAFNSAGFKTFFQYFVQCILDLKTHGLLGA